MNAATDGEASVTRQLYIRPNADRHHDDAGGNVFAILQPNAFDFAVAVNFGCVGGCQDLLPALFKLGF